MTISTVASRLRRAALGALLTLLLPSMSAGEAKNVQILKGLDDLLLQRTMNMIRGGLGTHCDYCHVAGPGGQWDFASDEKETKRTARKMMQMVIDINKASFNGEPRVTCFTCHQGATRPTSLLPLPQAAPPFPTPAPPRTAEAPPAAGEILDRYTEALGGRAALDKLTTRVMKGTAVAWDKSELPIEVVQEAPDKYLSTVTLPQGIANRGFDGRSGWTRGPRGAQDLSGGQLQELARSADFFRDIRLKERFPDLTVTGRQKIGDREAWVLQAGEAGGRIERFFFDTGTGLLVRRVTLTRTLVGFIPEEISYEDYRDAGGVKVPFSVTASYADPWIGQKRLYTEVQINVPVDRARFQKPAAGAAPAPAREGGGGR